MIIDPIRKRNGKLPAMLLRRARAVFLPEASAIAGQTKDDHGADVIVFWRRDVRVA